MTVLILTPIADTTDLPTGWYICRGQQYPEDERAQQFLDDGWNLEGKVPTHYYKPVSDVVVLTREEAGKIFKAGIEYHHFSDGPGPYAPDRQTYIDNLFKDK